MKVALIDPLGGYGGHHYYTDGLARGLVKAGQTPVVFTVHETKLTGEEPYRIIVAFRGLYGSAHAGIRGARALVGLIRAVVQARLLGCKLAHIHMFSGNLVEQCTALLARLAGMTLVIIIHDIEAFGNKSGVRGRQRMLACASAITVLNEFCREELERGNLCAGRPVYVVPCGNTIDNFPIVPDRGDARTKLGLPQEKVVFLFFGNSRVEKGLDILLHAMGPLRDDPNVLLLVAGKMRLDQEKAYRRIIADQKIDGITRMDVGLISDEDALSYYRAADVVVVPYRRIYNSGVALMAMSLGRAVLASRLPPLVELTHEGQCGLLFNSEDGPDLTRMLRWCIAQRAQLDPLGDEAKASMLRERGWDMIAKQTAGIYRHVMGQS